MRHLDVPLQLSFRPPWSLVGSTATSALSNLRERLPELAEKGAAELRQLISLLVYQLKS